MSQVENKKVVVVIVGPTASGKTAASIALAKALNGEIVSADSMQVYQKMNIGTAKPSMAEREGIPHYLLDVVSPDEEFNVTKYQELAHQAIDEIIAKGKLPIVVGGTGLYVSSLTDAIQFSEVPENQGVREALSQLAQEKGPAYLHQELEKIDPTAATKIDQNNVRRVIRALEIYQTTGKTKTQLDLESIQEAKYTFRQYGILWDKEALYARIEKRIDRMLEEGLVEEVKTLTMQYHFSKTALQGIGYKEVMAYLDHLLTYEEMVAKLKLETRHYAKRQMTWFKRNPSIKWCSQEEIVNTIIQDLKEESFGKQ